MKTVGLASYPKLAADDATGEHYEDQDEQGNAYVPTWLVETNTQRCVLQNPNALHHQPKTIQNRSHVASPNQRQQRCQEASFMTSYQGREGDKMKQKMMTVTSTANQNTHHLTWTQMMKMRAMMSRRRYGRLFRPS